MGILLKPSFYATATTGILILILIILGLKSYNEIKMFDTYRLLILISMFAIIISIHGVLHLGLEAVYDYNPLEILFGNKNIEKFTK
jgi:hypothetical protein